MMIQLTKHMSIVPLLVKNMLLVSDTICRPIIMIGHFLFDISSWTSSYLCDTGIDKNTDWGDKRNIISQNKIV